MRTWPSVTLPAIPGTGHPLTLRDTASGEIREISGSDGVVRLYVCGITPYDATHLGHAATYVTFDLVGRVLRDGGMRVRYVQNVTDVDDPLLERAARDGRDWRELATSEIDLFREDMTALGVLPPEQLIGVSESIDLIGHAVGDLVAAGAAYELANDGLPGNDVYLDLGRLEEFDTVSGLAHEEMIPISRTNGGDPDRPGKRGRLDPLLWRAERPGEPAWRVEGLPAGRPGWHIECTAIAREFLGLPVDIQGGGIDLVFPHHDMSAAQADAVGERFARNFVHQHLVGLHGEKMSKSKGNLVLVSRLRADGVPPMAIRLLLLAHRYDAAWDYTDDALSAAVQRLRTWHRALSVNEAPGSEAVVATIRAALADDLDSPRALAAVDDWAQTVLAGDADGAERPLSADGDEPLGPEAQRSEYAPGILSRTLDALLGIRL